MQRSLRSSLSTSRDYNKFFTCTEVIIWNSNENTCWYKFSFMGVSGQNKSGCFGGSKIQIGVLWHSPGCSLEVYWHVEAAALVSQLVLNAEWPSAGCARVSLAINYFYSCSSKNGKDKNCTVCSTESAKGTSRKKSTDSALQMNQINFSLNVFLIIWKSLVREC